MKRLCCVLCLVVCFSSYVSAEEIQGAAVETLAKTSASWDGQDLPDYGPGKPEVTILKIQIPPGSQLAMHKHLVINAGVLLRGQLTVVTEDKKKLRMKAGDPIVELVNTWHYGKNEGETPAEIIMFYAGKVGVPITVYPPSPTDTQPPRIIPDAAGAR